MHQVPLQISVWDAARRRLHYVFDEFDQVLVAFSGGKDSGLLLHLALSVLDERQDSRKLGVFHLDYEAQYSATTEYVDEVYRRYADRITPLRCCVPVLCPTCTSMHEMTWRPWDPDKRQIWVRDLPEQHIGLQDLQELIGPETSDYDFQEAFALWQHRRAGAKRTCVLIGIRAQESLDRWRTIVSDRNVHKYQGRVWTTLTHPGIANAYPIYDWSTEDVWTAFAQQDWPYNRLYDLMHYAGVPLHAMRVASPFHNAAKASLSLYRALDPQVWGRMVSRVNGVNFTAIYGDSKAMGWKKIEKPAHFTWQQYAEFLLDTLPPETAANYRAKLQASKKSWRVGGGMEPETIRQLEAEGAPLRRTGRNTNHGRGDKELIQFDDYLDDTTVDDFRRIPTYKRLCVCIMKNDHVCKYMGFALTKAEISRREAAIAKYKDL